VSQPNDLNRIRRNTLKALGAGTLAAAGVPTARAQARLEKMLVFIGTTPHFGNVIVADKKGFWQKEGLAADVNIFASGSVAAEAFRAGKGHVVVTGDQPAIRLWKDGFLGFAPQANYDELSIIVAKTGIKSPAEMKGRKVGVLVGSTSEFFTKLYLAKGGVDLKDIQVVNLRPAEMVTGFARGDIDAFTIWQPFGWRALAAVKDAHILATAKGYFHEWEACTTSRDYAKGHEAELVAFVKGLDAAGKWITANLDEAATVVATAIRLEDVKLARQMLEKIDWSLAYTPKFRRDMDFVGDFMNMKIDWKTMFETRYLAKAFPSYVS
jgi:ABC-type nitrate/sulfonate/bicarbonate transport system substrate-binding protein